MGKLNSPEKKNAQSVSQETETSEGKSMAPPAFALESSPVQMKGGWWDVFSDATEMIGEAVASVATAGPESKDDKTAAVVDPKEGKVDAKALTDYKLDKKDAVDPKTGNAYVEGDLTTLMLKKAGVEPASKWWSDFTTISLFGFQTNSLHSSFANLLKNAEAKTVEKISASKDYSDWATAKGIKDKGSAKSIGKFMGLKGSYSTLRAEEPDSASFHALGLAIDFNVAENPWISDSSGNIDKKDPKDKKKTVRDKTGVMKDALDRAGGLMGQKLEFHHVNPDHFDYDMASTYDNMSKIDKGFEQYFGMGLDAKDAQLKGYLDKTEDATWKGKTTTEARIIINNDLDVLSQWWDRKKKGDDRSEMIRTNGIMDLDRRMVLSMGEVGLDWGGKYGDMMHFDMRNTGVGKKLRAAKYDKDVKAKKDEMTAKMKADAEAAKIEKAAKAKADKEAKAAAKVK